VETEVTYSGGYVSASFDTLVETRYAWVQSKWNPEAISDVESRYLAALASFERDHGRILHEYWTGSVPGGVVVTNVVLRLRFGRWGTRAHFFRFTDYLSRRHPDADELLFAGDALAAICEEVLRGPTQRIALTQVYTAASQLLSSLDAYELSALSSQDSRAAEVPGGDAVSPATETAEERKQRLSARAKERAQRDEERRKFEEERQSRLSRSRSEYRKALARTNRFYRDGAAQSAQFYYFKGMLRGAVLVALMVFAVTQLLPVLADLWGLHLSKKETAAGFAAAAAGSLGACVSVMWRMTAGTFGQDAVFGADNLARLGAFRPFLGAMFGLILYVALQADVISDTYVPANPSWYFYIFLGFLAGFSERLVPDFLGDSGRALSRRTADDEQDSIVTVPAGDETTQAVINSTKGNSRG
jgi:hypothetical protein